MVTSDRINNSSNSEIMNNNLSLAKSSKKVFYITELDGEFLALDYTSDSKNPKITPLSSINHQQQEGLVIPKEVTSTPTFAQTIPETQPKSSKNILIIGIGLGLFMAFGANYIFSNISKQDPVVASSDNGVVTKATPQTVTLVEVASNPIERTLKASGTVHAKELIPVTTPATGLQIKTIMADEGNFVNKGQILTRLNDSTLQAELLQAKGSVSQAQARLAELRAGARSEEKARAREQVISAQAAVSQAESELDLIRKRVKRNQALEKEGAISLDRLDEILNQEKSSRANLDRAKASLVEAQQRLAELRAGVRPEIISQAQAEVAQAQGRLQYVQAKIQDTIVTAPTSGIVARRNARLGNITSPSETLFSIIENGKLELRLEVPETLIRNIRPQQKVHILNDNLKGSPVMGTVREIDPIVDGDSRQATVKVDLPSELDLKPGMFLRAEITTSQTQGETVPTKALLPQDDGTAIAFVVQEDNTVKATKVEIGEILPSDRIEVVKGLESGDRIVLKGAAYLKDGDLVEISQD